MVINSIDNSFEKLVESAKQLENKDIIRLFKALFPKLRSNKLQYLADILEVAIADAMEVENDALENTAKFLYKVVKSNNYVTLRVWGREECNEYLGPMPFLPGITYELTHMRTGETKTLTGHKLYRKQNQIYMVVEQLTPVYQMLEYLYYDRDSEFPRRPQDICIKKIFSRKDWNIEKLTNVFDANVPLTNEITNSSILKQTLKPVSPIDLNLHTSSKTKTSDFSVESNPTKKPVNSKLSFASKSARQQAALTVVPVNKNFLRQVKITIEQWVKLNKLLQIQHQWSLVSTAKSLSIHDSKDRILFEYNLNSQTIATKSPHILLNLLKNNLQFVNESTNASIEQKTLANTYLLRFSEAPQDNATKLLAYLFNL